MSSLHHIACVLCVSERNACRTAQRRGLDDQEVQVAICDTGAQRAPS